MTGIRLGLRDRKTIFAALIATKVGHTSPQ
ncbi:MAG: hypothetical protein ACI9GW_000555 [Halieaceae bacterium]|jgi:hypothetical protein